MRRNDEKLEEKKKGKEKRVGIKKGKGVKKRRKVYEQDIIIAAVRGGHVTPVTG